MFVCFESPLEGKVANILAKGALIKITLWVQTAANTRRTEQTGSV